MDRIRTLLLARTSTVVLDPDRVASAATRPSRDVDLERFEDELAQLGFVMSLDLAMTVRRLPFQTIHELKTWIVDTLGKSTTQRPHVPLATVPDKSTYVRRVLTWLATRAEQPCPWCSQIRALGALDPCGHLVCRICWDGGAFSGCPICHKRTVPKEPFVVAAATERVALPDRHDGGLRLVHLAFDAKAMARARFEALLARTARPSRDEREEIELMLDLVGPTAAGWIPARITNPETAAIVIARLWLIAPNRGVMMRATAGHLATATDVLRVIAVLMGADPALRRRDRLRSLPRTLRRAALEALARIEPAALVEDMLRRRTQWKRVGERLHPFERAGRLPEVALAFAAVRGSAIATLPGVQPNNPRVRVCASGCVRAAPWAAPVEDALRARDVAGALARLAERPDELLRRADALIRGDGGMHARTLDAIRDATVRGSPHVLLQLAAHAGARAVAWPRRVAFPATGVLRTWFSDDRRPPLPGDAITAIVDATRTALLTRAEAQRPFARAVIDRGLADALLVPRGSEVPLPLAAGIRLTATAGTLALWLYDDAWQRVDVVRGGDLDLDHPAARHAIAVVFGATAGGTLALAAGDSGPLHRFDIAAARIALPIALDLGARRVRVLAAALRDRGAIHRVGGYRAAFAHVARDVADHVAPRARATVWDAACIHAAARAHVIYVRERGGLIGTFRRRDGETTLARLARLYANDHDGHQARFPGANAPTWVALVRDDLGIPTGSAGYIADVRGPTEQLRRLSAGEIVAELAVR